RSSGDFYLTVNPPEEILSGSDKNVLIFLHPRSIDDKIGMDFHLAAVIFLHSDIRNQVARARRRHFRPSRLRIEPLDPDSQSFLGVIEIVALARFGQFVRQVFGSVYGIVTDGHPVEQVICEKLQPYPPPAL